MARQAQSPPTRGASGRRWLLCAASVCGGVLLGAAAWLGTDALEQDNQFCNACHLDGWFSGVPLHTTQRDEFANRPPVSLAAAHAAAGNPERPADTDFRCIDCHGGVGLAGRARVKLLAAKDAFWWLTGDFEEPEGMHWPLLDDDCRQCHDSFVTKAGPFEDPAFHDLAVHNDRLGVDCVECHEVHDESVEPAGWFLAPARVREECARCHSEFAGS